MKSLCVAQVKSKMSCDSVVKGQTRPSRCNICLCIEVIEGEETNLHLLETHIFCEPKLKLKMMRNLGFKNKETPYEVGACKSAINRLVIISMQLLHDD